VYFPRDSAAFLFSYALQVGSQLPQPLTGLFQVPFCPFALRNIPEILNDADNRSVRLSVRSGLDDTWHRRAIRANFIGVVLDVLAIIEHSG